MNVHDFCRILLQQARAEASDKGVTVPRRITALSDGNGQFFMEADGVTGEYVSADCAYEARAKYINSLIDRKEGQNCQKPKQSQLS